MEYREPVRMDQNVAEDEIATGEVNRICEALVSVAFFERDWQWAENLFLRTARHESPAVRAVSATCLGHLARIHRTLNREKVLTELNRLLHDPETQGTAEEAIADIEIYLT